MEIIKLNLEKSESLKFIKQIINLSKVNSFYCKNIKKICKIKSTLIFSLLNNSKVIGFIIGEILKSDKNKNVMCLQYIFINPKYRNLNNGYLLFKKFWSYSLIKYPTNVILVEGEKESELFWKSIINKFNGYDVSFSLSGHKLFRYQFNN